MLNGAPIGAIYPNLTGDLDLTQAKRLAENTNIAFQGPVMVGLSTSSQPWQRSFCNIQIHMGVPTPK